jgi:hypothetical protein
VCRKKMVAADHLEPAAAEMTLDPFAIGPHLAQRGVKQLTARYSSGRARLSQAFPTYEGRARVPSPRREQIGS